MDKLLKEKIISNIFEGLDKIIENEKSFFYKRKTIKNYKKFLV